MTWNLGWKLRACAEFILCNCGDRRGYLPHLDTCRAYKVFGP